MSWTLAGVYAIGVIVTFFVTAFVRASSDDVWTQRTIEREGAFIIFAWPVLLVAFPLVFCAYQASRAHTWLSGWITKTWGIKK